MKLSVRRVLAIRSREASFFVGGALVAATVTVMANVAGQSNIMPGEDCALKEAMQNAINSKVQMIGMTSPDPSKFFTVGSPDSCLGDLSLTKIDLSKMIPDPYGVISDALSGAFERIQKAAIEKACTVARGSMSDIIGKWNTAANQVNGIGGAVDGMIDQKIGDATKQAMDDWSLSWNTNKSTPTLNDIVSNSGSNPISTTSPTTSGSGVTLITQNGQNASVYTAAAANQESARLALERAKAQASSNPDNVAYQTQLQQAQTVYNNAVTATQNAKTQVIGQSTTQQTAPATTGGSVF